MKATRVAIEIENNWVIMHHPSYLPLSYTYIHQEKEPIRILETVNLLP